MLNGLCASGVWDDTHMHSKSSEKKVVNHTFYALLQHDRPMAQGGSANWVDPMVGRLGKDTSTRGGSMIRLGLSRPLS